MFRSYVQNSQIKMTKDAYFEMCDALGTAPVDSEIPIEIDDFPVEIQEVLQIYSLLRDDWDSMSGAYLGKNFIGITEIFSLMNINNEDRILYIFILRILDSIRSEEIKKQKSSE